MQCKQDLRPYFTEKEDKKFEHLITFLNVIHPFTEEDWGHV